MNREKLTELKESFWKEPIKEEKVTKQELAAAAERTKKAQSLLRKIHKAISAADIDEVMDNIEKAAIKGDIDDKQASALKAASDRRESKIKSQEGAPAVEDPTAAEDSEVAAEESVEENA